MRLLALENGLTLLRMLVAALKSGVGECPCHRCLIKRKDIHHVGTKKDEHARQVSTRDPDVTLGQVKEARRHIYDLNYAVDGDKVQSFLFKQSLTPNVVSIPLRIYYQSLLIEIILGCIH